jgi:glycolate oxidase
MQLPAPNTDILAQRSELLAQIRAGLPDGTVIEDAVELKAYECDGLAAYHCPPLAVSLPRSTK